MPTVTRPIRDLIIAASLALLVGLAGITLDLFTRDGARLAQFEIWTMDETLFMVWFITILAAWYIWRRQRDSVRALQQVNDLLEEQIVIHKATEQTLETREERFRHLVANANDTIVIVDSDSVCLYCSPAFERLLGYSPQETIGSSILAHVHPDDLPLLEDILGRAQAAPGQILQAVYRYQHQDGSWRVLESMGHNLLDTPAVAGIVVNTRDITEFMDAQEEIRRQAARAEALVQISSQLSAQIDLDRTLTVVCEETARALDVPIVTVSLFDEAKQALVMHCTYGVPDEFIQLIQPMPIATYHQYSTDGPFVVTPDVQALLDVPNADLYARMDLRTTINTMLTRHGQLVGRLNIATLGAVRTFTEDELSLLQGLAAQASQAIFNARLYTQARRRLDRLQALHAIDRAITTPQHLSVTLAALVSQVATQLGVDAVAVLILDPDSQTLAYAAGLGFHGPDIRHLHVRMGEGHAGRAAQERRTFYARNQMTDETSSRLDLLTEEGFVSHYSMPLVAQEELIGVLEIFHRTALAPDEEWLAFLEALSLQTAIAINHATLFDRAREQAEQLQRILDVVPEGMLVLDPDFHLLLANPAAQACLAQHKVPMAIGEPLTHLCHYPVSGIVAQSAQAPIWQELTVKSPPQTYEVASQPLQAGDATKGWVLLVRDVTDARRRQAMLQQQERLVTVGKLAAGIAHDFNNMLSPILLYAEFSLTLTPPDSQLYQNLEQIARAAMRARNLVAQILAFGRQDPNQQPKAIQMQSVIQEALGLLRASLPPNIYIKQQIQASADTVWVDPTQIHQIVMNLGTNAYHAMRGEGGILSVGLENVIVDQALAARHTNLDLGPYVRLTVRDTGHGIEPETLDHIFEPFFTTKEPGEGTGMGLAMVYGIVAKCNGEIVVESSPGAGTNFTIYLPIYEEMRIPRVEGTEPDRLMDAENAPTTWDALDGDPGPKTAHILVADDEESILQIAREVLELQGYEVTTTTSSTNALALLRQQPDQYDMLVTDLNMPEMSGAELVEKVRAFRADLPVILISGYLDQLTPQEISALQMQLLPKPFSIDTLCTMVEHAFKS